MTSKIKLTESLQKTIALEQRALADGGTLVNRNHTVNSIPYTLLRQNPSLVVGADAFKEGKIHSIIPNTTVGDFDYTQNTANGWVINQDGELENVPANTPRYTWLNGKPEILVEASRTNLFENSNPTAAESASNNVTYEAFSWDIGFSNCVKYGDNSLNRVYYGGSVIAGNDYTIGCFIQMDDNSEPLFENPVAPNDFHFRVGNTVIIDSVHKKNIPNTDIWFCYAKFSSAGTTLSNNGIRKSTSNSSKGFRATGLILFDGIVDVRPESFIMTTGGTATRNDDVINKTGVSSIIGQTEGYVVIDVTIQNPLGSKTLFNIYNDTNGDRIQVFYGVSSNNIRINIVTGGSVVYQVSNILPNQTGNHKIGLVYSTSTNGCRVFVDGVLFDEGTASSIPACDSYGLGCNLLSATPFNDTISGFIIGKEVISDSKMIELTTL